MENHETEERELIAELERHMAVGLGSMSSLMESYFKLMAYFKDRDREEVFIKTVDLEPEVPSTELATVDDRTEMYTAADYSRIAENEMRNHGINPDTIGQADADREWVRRADPADVVNAYRAADRWSGRSDQAKAMRENITAELADYGLDAAVVMSTGREGAEEVIATARASWWHEHGPAADAESTRDGAGVVLMLDDARRSDDRVAANTEPTPTPMPPAPATPQLTATASTRAQRIADHSGTTDYGRAAAIAAVSHPTHPSAALTSGRKDTSHPKAGSGVDRGRDKGMGR